MFAKYTHWLSRHYIATTFVSCVLFVLLGAGVTGLSVTNDMRAYFSDENPQLLAFERLEAIFAREDVISFILAPASGDIFTPRRLSLLYELTESAWQMPYARRVSSLANYQHTEAEGDNLIVERLIPAPEQLTAERVKTIREVSLEEPEIIGNLIAPKGSAAGVQVRLSMPGNKLDANNEVMDWTLALIEPIRSRYPDVAIHIGGTVASDVDLGRAVQGDVSRLVSFSYIIILAGLVMFLRHWRGTAATLLIVTLSIAGTMGLYGWLGFTLEAVSGFVPSIVMTIAVADCVHILTSYYHEIHAGRDKVLAVRTALSVNAKPVFVTSLTTAAGVLMLNFSDAPPYHDLGNMVAIGAMMAWLLSMTLLPALLLWMPMPSVVPAARIAGQIEHLGDWIIKRRHGLLIACVSIGILLASFIPRNELTENWNGYFDDTFEVRRASNALLENFGSMHLLRYIVDSGIEHGVDDPAFLADLERFAEWLRTQPEVVHVTAITDLLARLNMNLHGDDPAWRRIPDERGMAAQYLLLYEMSLPLGQGLEDTINVDRSATQLTTLLAPSHSQALISFDERAQRWLAANAPTILPQPATGIDMVFAHMNHRNIRQLLQGMVLGILGIAALLVVALNSLALGSLSLLTNLAPATLAYGTWGLSVAQIDMSASIVMCMSLGIVVDDTVHFLSKYQYARALPGSDVETALRYAFKTVGLALVVTTVVLVCGFSILGASHFSPTVRTGTLMAMTLGFALTVDLFVLPPLLLLIEQRSR